MKEKIKIIKRTPYILQTTGVNVYDPETESNYPRIDVEAALNSICKCDSWSSGSCGGGACDSNDRQYTRSCDPDSCAIETKCEYDVTCESGGGGTPDGIDECTPDSCSGGYDDQGVDCGWDGNNWECERTCRRPPECGDSLSKTHDSGLQNQGFYD